MTGHKSPQLLAEEAGPKDVRLAVLDLFRAVDRRDVPAAARALALWAAYVEGMR